MKFMKKATVSLVSIAVVAVSLVAVPVQASAGAATDTALALGAFAVLNQIVRGETIFNGRRPTVYSEPSVVYAPAPVVYQQPTVVYAPPPMAPPPVYHQPQAVDPFSQECYRRYVDPALQGCLVRAREMYAAWQQAEVNRGYQQGPFGAPQASQVVPQPSPVPQPQVAPPAPQSMYFRPSVVPARY